MTGTANETTDSLTLAEDLKESLIADKAQPKITENERKTLFTNQVILRVAAFSFGLFVISEIIGALACGALSLLGDSIAMGVDVITYLTNMYAEHIKSHHGGFLSKKARWFFDVVVPLFAVCSLLSVSIWICLEAVQLIFYPEEGEDDVSILLLYAYASANFVVDFIATICFLNR